MTGSHSNAIRPRNKITEDRLTARVWVTTTDYEALYYRNAFREDREKIKEQLKEKGYHVEDSTIVVKNALEFSEPYQYGYVADLNAEIINDKLYIAPFLKETITENPLKSNRRDYPVDMIYPSKKSYRTIMDIPEGYDISYIPADYRIRNSMLELEYTTERQVDNLIITFNYYFKQSVYSPGQYDDLKFYFREIVNKGNDRIVLVKRTDL